MIYPILDEISRDAEMISTFRGLDKNTVIDDSYFSESVNMSTDHFPLAAVRKGRGQTSLPENAYAMARCSTAQHVDAICLACNVNGRCVIKVRTFDGGETEIKDEDIGEWRENTSLIFRAGIGYAFPYGVMRDMFDSSDYSGWRLLSHTVTIISTGTEAGIVAGPCDSEGKLLTVLTTKPDSPKSGDIWLDNGTYKIYSESGEEWMPLTTNYIAVTPRIPDDDLEGSITATVNGEAALAVKTAFAEFKAGDEVFISDPTPGQNQKIKGSYIVEKVFTAKESGTTSLILNGVIDEKSYLFGQNNTVTVERRLPKMDYVIESGNRLWGCYYGLNDKGEVINEVYASALGDATNWHKYQGISTDSWTATIGEDGPFTGAIHYGGYPLFFKENCIIRIYGSAPSSFQTAVYNYRGVAQDSDKSLAICDEVLYYLSLDGIVAYNGGIPQKVSAPLGKEHYQNGVGGAFREKYYLSCEDSDAKHHLFVFDASCGAWIEEDNLSVTQFLRHKNELYMLTGGKVITAFGGTENVRFSATTGNWGLSDPYRKYFEKFIIRTIVPAGAELFIYVSYDDGEFVPLTTYEARGMTVAEVADLPRDCDRIRLRFKGRGDVKIVSIYREISEGGYNVY